MEITDETLMAFADGELPAAEAREVADRVAADPELAARARVFTATRDALKGLAPPPVPDALAERVRAMSAPPSNVVPLRPRRAAMIWQLPAAAAIALAVGLGGGWMLHTPQQTFGTLHAGLTDALTRVPSGERADVGDGTLMPVSTFRDAGGDLCREFEHDRTDGPRITSVACHVGDAWNLRLAVAGGGAEGYAPVSSGDALEAWFAATEVGPPLDPEAEAAALADL